MEQERVRLLARKLLDLVEEMSLENSPVLFHSFGNGGCVVYQGFCEFYSWLTVWKSLIN